MNSLDAYLFFDGTCADAMRFYERTLGGKLNVLTHADAPVPSSLPPEARGRVMHARLDLGDRVLMASDTMPGQPCEMKGFSLSLIYPTVPEAKRAFDALAAGGKVTMPFDKTFWADGFGMLVDRFGTPWMVNGAMQKVGP